VQNLEFCQITLFSKEPKHNRHNFYFCVLLLLSICKTHFCSDAPVQECLRLRVFSKPRRLVSGPQSNSDLWEIFSQLFPVTWWFCVCSKGERIGGLCSFRVWKSRRKTDGTHEQSFQNASRWKERSVTDILRVECCIWKSLWRFANFDKNWRYKLLHWYCCERWTQTASV